ncbi:hypothetical protein BAL199_30660 [alpha proteobacterium BAL199]|nr:hypothetical protein BAL199_30660 [alpha proteobacterium BAL199]
MASPLSSETSGEALNPGLTFRTQRGVTDVPAEWEPATIVLEGVPPEEWRSVRLFLNGRPLPVCLEAVGGAERVTADWERASSGTWMLEVSLGGTSRWSHLLRIRPAKISADAFAAMLDDLESGLPTSIAVGLDRLGAFTGLDWRPPRPATLAQEAEQVRRALEGGRDRPGLIATLHEVARDPHGILAPIRPWVPAERARRPSPVDLPAAFAKPGNLTEGLRPLKLADCRVEHSFDVYENRLLRAFRDQAGMRLRRVMRWLARSPAVPLETNDVMSRLSDGFAAACRAAAFLDGVGALRSAPKTLTRLCHIFVDRAHEAQVLIWDHAASAAACH